MIAAAAALAALVPVPPPDPEADARAVATLLRARCVACHGPEKQKARLRLDEAQGLAEVVVARDPDASLLWQRVSLSPEHDDLMPPKGDPLSADELALLRRWIEAGAPFATPAEAVDPRATARAELERIATATGALVLPAEPGGDPRGPLRVEFAYAGRTPTAEAFAALAPIAERIFELGLAGTAVAPGALAGLPPLPALERAHLERTALGDTDAAALVERAPNLRYLNLHSTAVTDAAPFDSLEHLERLVRHATSAAPAVPFAASGPRRLLTTHGDRVVVLQETTLGHLDEVWSHPRELSGRARWVDAGHVLLAGDDQLLLLELPTGAIQMFTKPEGGIPLASAPLPEGRTAVLVKSPLGELELVVLSSFGTPFESIELALEPDDDLAFASLEYTPDGTLLVGHSNLGRVDEYTLDGSKTWSFQLLDFDADGVLKDARRLPSGNTVIASGIEEGREPGRVLIEVNPAGDVVWRLEPGELPRLPWPHVTGVQPLAGGNLAVQFAFAPHLVELSRDKRVVWTLPTDNPELRLGRIDILEDPYRRPDVPGAGLEEDSR